MFLPLRTNRPPKRKPVVTEALMVINLLVFVIGLFGSQQGWFEQHTLAVRGGLWREHFHLWQLITYQFLHDPYGFWHIGANMLFLWVFGCAVEDRLGRASFLVFYLIGGAVAGLAHMALDTSPVIGASGAVAGVTGAFLALFPRSRILLLTIFGLWAIPSLWFIGFYFVLDLLKQTGEWFGGSEGGVAYAAHIAGYLYGFGTAFLLLAYGIVKREEFDVFFLFKQARRRAEFRAASRGGPTGLWESASADTTKRLAKQQTKAPEDMPEQREAAQRRSAINALIAQHKLSEAATKYGELLQHTPTAILAEQAQLDVANQLYADEQHELAAQTYELMLKHYPRSSHIGEVGLLLGLLYTRRLNHPSRAKELIEQAKVKIKETTQLALADQLLAELGTP